MSDYTVKRFDEMDAKLGGAFKLARHSLGVSAFGLQVLDFPPGAGEHYPNHDHAKDGQEEVYICIAGGGTLTIDDDEAVALEPDVAVRVGPTSKRHLAAGGDGVRLIVIGGTPGQAFTAGAWTQPSPPQEG